MWGTSLVVQWLRLSTPSAGGPGLIPGQGTRPHMPQLRPSIAQEIKINIFFLKGKRCVDSAVVCNNSQINE